jgi:hypothetical protein
MSSFPIRDRGFIVVSLKGSDYGAVSDVAEKKSAEASYCDRQKAAFIPKLN